MNIKNFDRIISNKPNSLFDSFKAITKNKFLIYCLIRKSILTTYSQSIIGPLYFIFLPLFQTIIFSFFLNNILSLETNTSENFILLLVSMTFWNFFSNCTVKCGSCYFINKRLITKVYFERLIFFAQTAIFSLIIFVINFLVTLITILIFFLFKKNIGVQLSYRILFLPLLLFYSIFFSVLIGVIIASLSIRFRDLLYGLNFSFQLLLFLSPVLYSLDKLQGINYFIMLFNPCTFFLEFFRWCFYPNNEFNYNIFFINLIFLFVLVFLANFYYKKSNLVLSDEI